MSDHDLAPQPNDAYFKDVFSDPGRASAFFQSHLPVEIASHIQWPSLALVPGSFVKKDLKQSHSDLLFTVQAGPRELKLYLLFEHQTTVDPALRLRMLGYFLEILRDHHENHGLPLPPVLGYVLHQGPDTWTVSQEFGDLFDLPGPLAAALAPYLPTFRHALLDLTQFDPASEEHDRQLQIVLQLMKLARTKQVLDFFRWLSPSLRITQELPDEFLRITLLYALHADPKLDVETIYHTLKDNPELRNQTMSAADKLIAKGRVEGRQEGVWIGKLQLLQSLMKFPVTPDEELQSLVPSELQRRFEALEKQYSRQFKDPS